MLGKRKKLANDSSKPEVSIAGSSNLSIQEKENIANYQENTPNTFNAPSPVRKVFQNLPQISVSELIDMEIDDNSSIQAVQSIQIKNCFFFFIELISKNFNI